MRLSTVLAVSAGLAVAGCASAAAAQVNETFIYDVHGRLRAATHAPVAMGSASKYFLDAADNRTQKYTDLTASRTTGSDRLAMYESLLPQQYLISPDARFVFWLQIDGNAVIYGPSGALWSTNTAGGTSVGIGVQNDGNLVMRDYNGVMIWQSGTPGHSSAQLVMQNDGNLVLYDGSTAIWSSGTGGH